MIINPGKDPQQWASFNAEYSKMLSGYLPFLSFVILVALSVYGFQTMFADQFPGFGILVAIVASFILQVINAASLPFSTRVIVSLFLGKHLKANKNQRMNGIGYFIGVLCLIISAAAITVDFIANHEANKVIAENATRKPEEKKTDSAMADRAIAIAEKSVDAERRAETAERNAYAAKVDAKYATRASQLRSRLRQLSNVSATWAKNECRSIQSTLNSIESSKQAEKAAFQPKTSNVAAAEKKFADAASSHSAILMGSVAYTDTLNRKLFTTYESTKQTRKNGLFFFYLLAIAALITNNLLKQYRAIRFDEVHPDGASALGSIFQTLGQGLENYLWKFKAWLYDLLPEDEIRGGVKTDLLANMDNALNERVYNFVVNNQGCNEIAIYSAFRTDKIEDVRYALRVLKTAKCLAESSNLWTADESQARFFFDQNKQNITGQHTGFQQNSSNFGQTNSGSRRDYILQLIADYTAIRPVSPKPAYIDQLIADYNTILTVM